MNNYNPRLVGGKSDRGPVREANEDAFWVSTDKTPTELGALYIVADGVGGQEHGAAAANRAVQVINQVFYQQRRNHLNISQSLQIAIQTANEAILAQSQANDSGKMGCTVVTAVQHNGRLHIAHVGDARAYLLSGGKLHSLTRDDTWVQKQVEAGVITPEQAAKHELRNVVTQVLGNKEEIEVHLAQPRDLQANDAILLCSDGLHDKVQDDEIVALLSGRHPQTAAEQLVAAAIAAETHDNVTAVVVKTDVATAARQQLTDTGSMEPITLPTQPAATAVSQPVAPVPAALPPGNRRPPVALLIGGAILVILIIAAIFTLANGGSTAATATPGVQSIVNETATSAPAEATATPILAATAPVTATAVPLLDSTQTSARSTVTATPDLLPRACLLDNLFLWEDAQLAAGNCNQFAQTALVAGTEVIILDGNPRPVNGPDAACAANQFIRVRTTTAPLQEGWVLAPFIAPLLPGENCAP